MDTTYSVLVILLLLVANGFYVAAEFALVKAHGFRIETLAAEGSSAAKLTVRIQANLESYLAACQLGITMASLGLGWVGEPAVAAILEPIFTEMGLSETVVHTSSFIIGFLIFSALHIVIGEQVPKTFAIRKPEPVSVWVAYPLHASYILVWPLNWLLNHASSAILSVFGIKAAGHGDVFTSDELKGLVASSIEHGEIHATKAEMLHNLFDFDQRQVGRIMIPSSAVHCLDVSAPVEKNLQVIRETQHSRFPLVDSNQNDALVGTVLTKDIYRALMNGEAEPWQDLTKLKRESMIVAESQPIAKLFDEMRSHRAHMACVVDEYGEFAGIVTLEDLLEEIVGEINDEKDNDASVNGIAIVGDEQWEADGLVTLSDLEREVGLNVPQDLDANTISGLFMRRLSRMPVVDDEIVEGKYRLRVIDKNKHRVGKVAISVVDVMEIVEEELAENSSENE